jgi:hypothetical protein
MTNQTSTEEKLMYNLLKAKIGDLHGIMAVRLLYQRWTSDSMKR